MSDEDLVYLQLKTRTERVDVNPEQSRRIREWNKLDSAIYDHFYGVFNEKIKAFGTDRMAKEVINLRNGIARVKQECVEVTLALAPTVTLTFSRARVSTRNVNTAGSCATSFAKAPPKCVEK